MGRWQHYINGVGLYSNFFIFATACFMRIVSCWHFHCCCFKGKMVYLEGVETRWLRVETGWCSIETGINHVGNGTPYPDGQGMFLTLYVTIRKLEHYPLRLGIATDDKKMHQWIVLVANRRFWLQFMDSRQPKWFLYAFSRHQLQWPSRKGCL